ncbi:IS200/IS605 family element transposase accessory protein TnpB [Chloroflexia bacterium SDU3-3]|nr:IS200/IS605 family element transposase accessory protein TnpB [Chloroflexia bacterium SDU3-3]
MKLTAQIQLRPTPAQADALRRTLETANAACNAMSATAWETGTFGQFALHKLCYADTRAAFGLSAQVTVRCIAKVADAYKLDKKAQRTFALLGAVAYDARILSFNLAGSSVSIWTMDGRQAIPFVCGERQRAMLEHQKGESDLVFKRGKWYLLVTCEAVPAGTECASGVLGVALGVTNIATDSDGTIYSGKAIKNVRYRHRRLRGKLQKKGTKSARRRLQALSGKEYRFARHVNHVLSKQLVATAKRTKRAIALEDLTHIRTRVRARRSQHATLHSWAFAQLRAFVTYKAQLAGVTVHFVDPRNTSRECPNGGHTAKENRKTQASFVCTSCGFAGLADVIAAGNISRRAAVNPPHGSRDGTPTGLAGPKPAA